MLAHHAMDWTAYCIRVQNDRRVTPEMPTIALVSHRHHNTLDPRDPLAPVFYFTFLAQDNGRPARRSHGRDTPGCACLLPTLLAIALLWMIHAK